MTKNSRIVRRSEFGLFSRIRARLGLYKKFGDFFLGYCKIHKAYFLDRDHWTRPIIRCPVCYKKWLSKHKERLKI